MAGLLAAPPLVHSAIRQAQGQPQPQQPPVPPGWYDNKQSAWQNSLNLAERQRDQMNAYNNWGAEQSHWVGNPNAGTGGSEGGYSGGHTVDWNNMKLPEFNGPKAYGLNGMTSGGDWGNAAGNDSTIAEQLARVRQFDPNAKVETFSKTVGGEQAQDETHYRINFDESKLPKPAFDAKPGQWQLAGSQGQHVIDERNMRVDPNYGVYTPTRNLKQEKSWIDTVGMMAPVALAMATGGMGALPSLLMKAPGILNNAVRGNFDPFSIASMALPYIPGVSPFMSQIGKIGLNYIGSQRRGR